MISIITPVWNRIDLTASFITQNQRLYQGKDVEFVIINNGSTDGTYFYLETAEANWNQLSVIHNDRNRGFGPANNQGVKAAKHDKILLVNNDIIVRGDYAKIMAEAIQDNCIYGAQLFSHNTGWNVFDGQIIPYLAGWCLGMTKATFEALGGFDERYIPGDYEDLDLCYTATKQGIALHQIDVPLAHMFEQTAATQLENRRAMTLRHQKLFMEKWGFSTNRGSS